MIPKNDSERIQALNNRMRIGRNPGAASAVRYHRRRTLPKLLWLIDSAGDLEGLDVVRTRLASCTRSRRCRFYGCPVCGRQLRQRLPLQLLKRIVAKLGRMPTREEISFVTINGSTMDLGEPAAVKLMMASLRRRVRDFVRRWPGASCVGLTDVSLNGLVHFHGVILHPQQPIKDLQRSLKRSFRRLHQAKVSKWDATDALSVSALRVLEYAVVADRHAKVGRYGPSHGVQSARKVAQRLVCLHECAAKGTRGLLLEVNLKGQFVWKAGVLFNPALSTTIPVPELEDKILAVRRKTRRIRTDWFRRNLHAREVSDDAMQAAHSHGCVALN